MERVLVAYATRRGSTGEAALAIGEQFARAGFEVDVRPCSRARGPAHYRAVVVGSAVYDGDWEPSAVSYLRRHATALASRPTWLFQRSSPEEQPSAPEAVLSLAAWVGLEGPTVFTGSWGGRARTTRCGAGVPVTTCRRSSGSGIAFGSGGSSMQASWSADDCVGGSAAHRPRRSS